MSRRGSSHVELTEREREILKLLVEHQDIKQPIKYVASVLNITPEGIRNSLYRLRLRYAKAMNFVREYRKWKLRMRRNRYL